MKRISPEEIVLLNYKWEEEYEDVVMTDAEWECKRFSLIAQAQLDSCKKEHEKQVEQAIDAAITAYESTCEALIREKVREILEEIESKYGDRVGRITGISQGSWLTLKKKVTNGK